ncbi:TPA: hypothetical protein ACX6QT_000022 [Photobacterium damselae]|uniref:hypothetical protein n=1 Tax=Photobacterium damselae TaxID=38293 RepID=UPI0010FCE767|nr:hypothetical protein [Photobacterium damselae]MCG3811181.1 hypothetical protein [Photobacterium damselae]MCG3824338.1 hypothetical protein [Photobacterium damselae]MDC4168147.1 hypothetical protein [Photobacterium damselae]TLS83863.1 hypothetical protein FD719_05265 [Photobacterium damselae subsp. damselae]TLS91055.1 hypothetical protein FD722_06800 [Photobacterium damselae subsp. damselae]
MATLNKTGLQDHPILQPFRLNGRWYLPEEKTIALHPSQTAFLLMNGKIGEAINLPKSQPKETKGQAV